MIVPMWPRTVMAPVATTMSVTHLIVETIISLHPTSNEVEIPVTIEFF